MSQEQSKVQQHEAEIFHDCIIEFSADILNKEEALASDAEKYADFFNGLDINRFAQRAVIDGFRPENGNNDNSRQKLEKLEEKYNKIKDELTPKVETFFWVKEGVIWNSNTYANLTQDLLDRLEKRYKEERAVLTNKIREEEYGKDYNANSSNKAGNSTSSVRSPSATKTPEISKTVSASVDQTNVGQKLTEAQKREMEENEKREKEDEVKRQQLTTRINAAITNLRMNVNVMRELSQGLPNIDSLNQMPELDWKKWSSHDQNCNDYDISYLTESAATQKMEENYASVRASFAKVRSENKAALDNYTTQLSNNLSVLEKSLRLNESKKVNGVNRPGILQMLEIVEKIEISPIYDKKQSVKTSLENSNELIKKSVKDIDLIKEGEVKKLVKKLEDKENEIKMQRQKIVENISEKYQTKIAAFKKTYDENVFSGLVNTGFANIENDINETAKPWWNFLRFIPSLEERYQEREKKVREDFSSLKEHHFFVTDITDNQSLDSYKRSSDTDLSTASNLMENLKKEQTKITEIINSKHNQSNVSEVPKEPEVKKDLRVENVHISHQNMQ